MIYDMKECGKRIQLLRTQNGYTQEELAKVLNIDRSNLSRIESGKRSCSLELLIQISSLFNVSLDYLVLDQDKASSAVADSRGQLKNDLRRLIEQMELLSEKL